MANERQWFLFLSSQEAFPCPFPTTRLSLPAADNPPLCRVIPPLSGAGVVGPVWGVQTLREAAGAEPDSLLSCREQECLTVLIRV